MDAAAIQSLLTVQNIPKLLMGMRSLLPASLVRLLCSWHRSIYLVALW